MHSCGSVLVGVEWSRDVEKAAGSVPGFKGSSEERGGLSCGGKEFGEDVYRGCVGGAGVLRVGCGCGGKTGQRRRGRTGQRGGGGERGE